MVGVIRKLTAEERIGWVRLGEGAESEIYPFRTRSLVGVGYAQLRQGQPVQFELRWDRAGRRCWAVDVRPA